MRVLMRENCKVPFSNVAEMSNFLKEMNKLDQWKNISINKIKTGWETLDGFRVGVLTHDKDKFPLWSFSLGSLERRSGDDASGHELMNYEQILDSMNNYWYLHKAKEEGKILIRGGRVMVMGSKQYEPISQSELFEAVVNYLDKNHKDGYKFKRGFYSHEFTSAVFNVFDSVDSSFRAAWVKASLPESMLNGAAVEFQFITDDVTGSAAKLIATMVIGGTKMLLGDPVSVVHRAGQGSISDFTAQLNALNTIIEEEMYQMKQLMKVDIANPYNAAVNAIKRAGLVSVSKKACKELVEDFVFMPEESAFACYMAISGILDTSYGRDLSDERKLRMNVKIRKLLTADWNKFDSSEEVTL